MSFKKVFVVVRASRRNGKRHYERHYVDVPKDLFECIDHFYVCYWPAFLFKKNDLKRLINK